MTWTNEEIYLVAGRAYEMAMQGRYLEAQVLFEGLLSAVPGNIYARRALAAIHLKQGRGSEALAVLDAGGSPARDVETRRLRLEALLALGWRDEAAAEYRALRARLDPGSARRYSLLLERGNSAGMLPIT